MKLHSNYYNEIAVNINFITTELNAIYSWRKLDREYKIFVNLKFS